jgi:hypothetical protein
MSASVVARLYRSVLRSLPDHVSPQDRSEMVDELAEMWRDARGPRQKGRVIMAVILPLPRLWIAEWWDALTDSYSGVPVGAHAARIVATRTPTPLPVRARPLTLALVVCAMASRIVSVEALFFSSTSEFAAQVTAFFGGLAFFIMVACSNTARLLISRGESLDLR